MSDNLRNPDGTIGTPEDPQPKGAVYCDSCGSESPGHTDVYHPATDTWERNVPCPMHTAYAH
jgi:hypothetical protein